MMSTVQDFLNMEEKILLMVWPKMKKADLK